MEKKVYCTDNEGNFYKGVLFVFNGTIRVTTYILGMPFYIWRRVSDFKTVRDRQNGKSYTR
jgi:hypothetical protein